MNLKTIKLTDKEIETLCELWLECRLSRADELSLMKVLADTPVSSPLADDVRALMGIETIREKPIAFPKRRHAHLWLRRKPAIAIAAALTALACTTTYMSMQRQDSEVKCVVYANGELVEDTKLSQQMARADYLESMRFMKEMEEFKSAQLKEANLSEESF